MNKPKLPIGIIIKRIILIILAIIVLTIAGFFALIPLVEKLDQNRFETLDKQMQGLFQTLQLASNGTDAWQYEKICKADMAGWAPTGDFICHTLILLEKPITTVNELNDSQSKYYPLLDNSDTLKQETNLDPQLASDFGINFVVSSAEKSYKESKTGISCNYLIKLNQVYDNVITENSSYSSEIDGGTGNLRISLRCDDFARSHWYPVDYITSTFI